MIINPRPRCPKCGKPLVAVNEISFFAALQYEIDNLHRYAAGLPPKRMKYFCRNKKIYNKTYSIWLKLKHNYKIEKKERKDIINTNLKKELKYEKKVNRKLQRGNYETKREIEKAIKAIKPPEIKQVPPKPEQIPPKPLKYLTCEKYYNKDTIPSGRKYTEFGVIKYYKTRKRPNRYYFTYNEIFHTVKFHIEGREWFEFW